MSDRGSFTTEYIYCNKCLEVAKEHLIKKSKWLTGVQIPSWHPDDDLLPIIAGKIGGSGSGDIYDVILQEAEEMANEVCHKVRIAVIPEDDRLPDCIIVDPEKKEAYLIKENEAPTD